MLSAAPTGVENNVKIVMNRQIPMLLGCFSAAPSVWTTSKHFYKHAGLDMFGVLGPWCLSICRAASMFSMPSPAQACYQNGGVRYGVWSKNTNSCSPGHPSSWAIWKHRVVTRMSTHATTQQMLLTCRSWYFGMFFGGPSGADIVKSCSKATDLLIFGVLFGGPNGVASIVHTSINNLSRHFHGVFRRPHWCWKQI